MGFSISGLLEKLGIRIIPELVVYGNCDSCIVEFKGEIRAYRNLHDAERVVGDFGLVGKEIRVKTSRREYEGHEYCPMRPIPLDNFRSWIRKKGIKISKK